ncbi:FapA family protein [Acetohalobium arabaticum]|uniref:Flagellar Assembly Protein A N-terminal region domain-containing protein n=1 Tax=Acetohalobium arabaticum (strain ATCC 49924 / DSM 5501 / Z-7288) TaxID=574087 RepID=D9QRI1_ACEAZ|nr:FapA family protein [Acetohalobium arabaticum]ADL13122.1 protein of unknown function DUF342 [Acetohalobium arabaticum DSM 5501]
MREVKLEATNEAEAIQKALEELELQKDYSRDELDIKAELIEEEKGFLGFGAKKIYQVQVSIPEDGEEKASEEVEEKVEFQDGEVDLIVNEEGIFIQLTPPQGNGEEVSLVQIEDLLEAKEITEVDYDQVSEALTEDIYNEPIQVAQRKPELDRDAEIGVNLKNDGMEAYLSIKPALGGKKATLERIKSALAEAGVAFGIKEQKLKDLVDEDGVLKQEIEEVLIAKGAEPVKGSPAEIDFKFDLESEERQVRELENGSVDYLNLNKINNVKPGDVLATKTPSQSGSPGTTVTGDKVEPEPVEDKSIPAGKNTKLSSDSLTLESEIEGQVIYERDKIDVVPVHTVQGDVDLSTGNIKFVGTVVIEGDVIDGMRVEAKEDIQVKGSVHAAELEAGEEILVKNGFIGKDKGELSADGDIKVKFIENGRVVTDNDLIVTEAIMHSDIDAARIIRVENKGLIVGGKIRAGREIEAKVVGSNLGTKTELYVGVTPELRDKYNQLKDELADYQQELEEAVKTIKYLKKKQEQNDGQLSDRDREVMGQKTRARFQTAKEIEDLKEDKESLEKRLDEGKNGRIKVQDTLHSGVKLTIGTEVKRISKKLTNVQYYIEDGEVNKGSYS